MEYRKLSDIAKLIGGYAFKSSEYVSEGIRVIRIANVQDGYISDEFPCFYPISIIDELGEANLVENDLLMSLTGNVGRVGMLQKEMLPAGLNQRVECIRPYNVDDKEYLFHYFKSNAFLQEALKNSNGIAQLNMSTVWLANKMIPIYDKQRQKEIVSILNSIKESIESDKKQLKLYDEIIVSRFTELFGDPIQNNKQMPVTTLKKLAIKITNGNTPKGGDLNYVDNGIMFIRSQNVLRNKIDYSDIVYISRETNEKLINSCLMKGDLLITKTGRYNTENSSLGRPALFDGEDYSANLNGHVYMVRLNNAVNKKYVLSVLLMPQYKEYIRSVCVGGTDKRQLNKNHIEDFPIILPELSLQNEFVKFVVKIEQLKDNIQKHLELMQELLDKKMDEYFGGE